MEGDHPAHQLISLFLHGEEVMGVHRDNTRTGIWGLSGEGPWLEGVDPGPGLTPLYHLSFLNTKSSLSECSFHWLGAKEASSGPLTLTI